MEHWPEAVGYGRAGASREREWEQDQDWPDWGPPPELYPDHPSAPVPRVEFPADHPSAPMPAVRSARPWGPPPPVRNAPRPGPGPGYPRLHAVPGFGAQANIAGSLPGPEYTAQLAREAQDYAVGIREAAQREAAAITGQALREAAATREAAEHEAAEFLARLDQMSAELRRVAASITESLVAPARSAPPRPGPPWPAPIHTAPPRPDEARPAPAPSRPAPGRPASSGAAAPAAAPPATRPAEPEEFGTTPARTPRKAPRQRQAMRIATASTAALLSFAVVAGAAELGQHGYKFFVFRAGGVGQTPGNETDQQFLNRQAAAAHHATAPKGRHARRSPAPAETHKNRR